MSFRAVYINYVAVFAFTTYIYLKKKIRFRNSTQKQRQTFLHKNKSE